MSFFMNIAQKINKTMNNQFLWNYVNSSLYGKQSKVNKSKSFYLFLFIEIKELIFMLDMRLLNNI
jgi:hypothetical protein